MNDRGSRTMRRVGAALALLVLPAAAMAASLEVRVEDQKGRPVADAVVAAVAAGAPAAAARPGTTAVIDQIDKQFIPYVSAIPVGTAVSFPNGDDIRHHVYSFSEPKKFELPLYKGTPTDPVVFDRPGLVVLGCNIHDWMLAYVYVLETPYFALTGEDGTARLQDLPPGRYDVVVRHPRLKGDAPARTVEAGGESAGEPLAFSLRLKPDFRRSGAPRSGASDY